MFGNNIIIILSLIILVSICLNLNNMCSFRLCPKYPKEISILRLVGIALVNIHLLIMAIVPLLYQPFFGISHLFGLVIVVETTISWRIIIRRLIVVFQIFYRLHEYFQIVFLCWSYIALSLFLCVKRHLVLINIVVYYAHLRLPLVVIVMVTGCLNCLLLWSLYCFLITLLL